MRLKDDLEFLEIRNRSMMFFLSLNIASHLGNLRFAHRERAVSFLPRESGGVCEGSRDPSRRVRFQLSDKLRDGLILPELRQDVNMIGGAIHNDRDSAFTAYRAAKVFVNSRPDRPRHPRLAVLRRKHDVVKKVAVGGTHRGRRFPSPLFRGLIAPDHIPGVPLRSTPSCSSAALHCRLYSAAPSALLTIGPRAPRHRRDGSRRCCSLALRCSPYCVARPTLSSIRPAAQRRRRDGLEPGVKRSETPGTRWNTSGKPRTRGGGRRSETFVSFY